MTEGSFELFYTSNLYMPLWLDGAMGTMVQSFKLHELDYRGTRFSSHSCDLKGNHDVLSLTMPSVIEQIHKVCKIQPTSPTAFSHAHRRRVCIFVQSYLEAGVDIIETNTFNSNAVSQEKYKIEDLAYEMNTTSAALAKRVAAEFSTPEKPRFVAGSMGPTHLSISRGTVGHDRLVAAYAGQARGLMDGGADVLLIETIVDPLNAKAALEAIKTVFDETSRRLPIFVSVVVNEATGLTLSGHTPEQFVDIVYSANVDIFSFGINCFSLFPTTPCPHPDATQHSLDHFDRIQSFLKRLRAAAEFKPAQPDNTCDEPKRPRQIVMSVCPNAGFPNEEGEYKQTAVDWSKRIKVLTELQLAKVVGGCCGTTPDFIGALVHGAQC